MVLPDTVSIRKVGGSLYFRLPGYYRHKFNLKVGDQYQLIPNMDGTIFKLVKSEDAEPSVDAA